MARPLLSLVIPIRDAEDTVHDFHERLRAFLARLTVEVEVVLVNDGSRDKTLDLLRQLAAGDTRFKVISLTRRFGNESAIAAGLDHARGAAVVVMDATLTNPPEAVLEMVEQWRAGFDVVYGQPIHREGESRLTLLGRWFGRRFVRAFVPLDVPLDATDFRLMGRDVVLALRSLRETHRFVRGIVSWLGFRQTSILYEPGFAKPASVRARMGSALDRVASVSVVPLRFATWMGMLVSFVAVVVAIWGGIARVFFGWGVSGGAAVVVLVALVSGVQLLMIGIIGEYVGRIYEQVKARPLYLVEEWMNLPRVPDTDERDEQTRGTIPARIAVDAPPVAAATSSAAGQAPAAPFPPAPGAAHAPAPGPAPGFGPAPTPGSPPVPAFAPASSTAPGFPPAPGFPAAPGFPPAPPPPGAPFPQTGGRGSAPPPLPPRGPGAHGAPAQRSMGTLAGVSPRAPASFPPLPQTNTAVMDVAPTREAMEIALRLEAEKAAAMAIAARTDDHTEAHSASAPPPGVLVTATPGAPLPPQLVTAAMPAAPRAPKGGAKKK